MHRFLAVCVGLFGLTAFGCASQPPMPEISATASVDAGPPACESLRARIVRSETRQISKAGTWLDAPNRMVESRRLRALEARAEGLGCSLPQT